jgi:FdhD protein
MTATDRRRIVRYRGGEFVDADDAIVAEAPMEIRLAGVPLAVLMRTPGADRELVLGFALTEGIVLKPAELAAVEPVGGEPPDSRWELRLADGIDVDPERFRRNLYATSSCGVCGKASIDAVRVTAGPAPGGPRISASLLESLPASMRRRQPTFDSTGGLHAAALFAPDGTLLVVHEDIGRHNATDKAIGTLAATSWPIGERILLVSGRVSFEIVQKAAVAGIPFVAGISAVSSLAVELAEELGLTVVGFLRGESFNAYTGAERIV